MSLHYGISGQKICIEQPDGMRALHWPNRFWNGFEANGSTPDIHARVHVGLKKPRLNAGPVLFDAGALGRWKLRANAKGYVLEVAANRGMRDLAHISEDYSKLEIWTRGRYARKLKERCWMPLEIFNPAVEICYLTRLARRGGLLLHAGGVVANSRGLIFAGQSEAGKTTISRFFHEKGFQVLNDERVAVLTQGKRAEVCGTPWTGLGELASNQRAPLQTFYFLKNHSKTHSRQALAPAAMSAWLFRQCFLPHWDREAMEQTATTCADLACRIQGYELSFRRDPDVVDFCLAANS